MACFDILFFIPSTCPLFKIEAIKYNHSPHHLFFFFLLNKIENGSIKRKYFQIESITSIVNNDNNLITVAIRNEAFISIYRFASIGKL